MVLEWTSFGGMYSVIKAPDGGWGWMVVLGSALAHFLVVGIGRSFGVFFTYLVTTFDDSAANIAWIIAIHNTVRQCLGPFIGILSNKLTCRVVVMLGGVIMAFGFIISAFANSVLYLYITFGLIAGLGGAFIFTPSYVIIGQYFDKKKGKAMAIATMGSGLGSVALAPILTALLFEYSFFGCMIIAGGIMANNCVAGALYRPIKYVKEKSPIVVPVNDAQHNDGEENRESKAEDENTIGQKTCSQVFVGLMNNLSILGNITFVLYGLQITGMSICIQIFMTFLPGIAEEYGSNKIECALLLSIVGISDMVGRFLWGFVFDLKTVRMRRRLFHSLLGIPVGGLCIVTGLMKSYTAFGVMAVLWGLVEGGFHSQRASPVSEFVPRNEMAKTVGFVIAFQGIGNMLGPPVAGMLKDSTGSFAVGFFFGGLCLSGLCIIFLLDYGIRNMRLRKNSNTENVEA